MKTLKSILDRATLAINVLLAFLLFLMAVLSFLPFHPFAAISVLSLVVPLLVICNLLFLSYWAFKKNRRAFLSLIALGAAYLAFGSFFGFGKEQEEQLPGDLKIMTYNVWGFNKNGWIDRPGIGDGIVELIKEQDPDILCLQEHSRERYSQLRQFPYRSVTPSSARRTVQAIFSKYPIVGEGSLDLPGTINNVIYADIAFGKDTIRVYNAHLQSFRIVPSTSSFSDGKRTQRTYQRLVDTFSKQMEQARLFRDHLGESPYINLIGGDLNNTQFSNIYKVIKGEMQDSFLEAGRGFGGTFKLFHVPIRIDYILADPRLKVLEHHNFDKRLSDHYPVLARLRLESSHQ